MIEVLGYSFHRTRSQMQRDAERMNQLVLDGFVVLQFTYLDVTDEPDWSSVRFVMPWNDRSLIRRDTKSDCETSE